MFKMRSKKISLLLVLAMLVMMFASIATASATSSDNGILTVSKSVNKNIAEEKADNLGYVKAAVDSSDVEAGGKIYWSVTLPDDVYFDEEDGDTDANGTITIPEQTSDFSATLPLDKVWVASSSADDINVDVTLTYVDANNNEIDKYEGTLLLAQKGTEGVKVTAASPKAVTMGYNKKIAKVTFTEDLAGSMENGSKVVMELPDGFKWTPYDVVNASKAPAEITKGNYGLNATAKIDTDDASRLILTIATDDENGSTLADTLKVVGYVNVMPDASDGDVVVSVYDESADGYDSNVDSTDLTVATVGGADVTVTAKDTTSSPDYIYRATEGKSLWDITLKTTGSFSAGDDLLLTLPDGVEFNKDQKLADANLTGLTSNGTYNDNQSLWLTVTKDTSSDLVIKGLQVGVTPDAKVGDLSVALSGDVVDSTVVASTIADKATVTAAKANVQVGLDALAGNITLVENKDKAFTNDQDIYLALPNGVSFSSEPTVTVNGDEVDNAATIDDDVCVINLDKLKTSSKDTIVISDIKYDIDNRYIAGNEISVKIGGKNVADDVNELNDGGQFDDEATDAVYTVANAVVGSANAANVVFTIGATTYTNNGVTSNMDVAPFIQNNRTYVPVRYIANSLGISDQNIIWDAANQTVTLLKGDKVVQFKIGSTTRIINGISTTMDVAPTIVNNRTFLPARFVAEAFGASVAWDAAAPTLVNITVK